MNENSLPEAHALNAGAHLWIIKNDPDLYWWKKLDLNSKYLLSQNLRKPKQEHPIEIQKILNATDLSLQQSEYTRNSLLLGTGDHFLNTWLLLWENLSDAQLVNLISMTTTQLKTDSIRLFSHSHIFDQLATRLTASSMTISYIEKT